MRAGRFFAAQAALALVATVIGAGFASGREVLRFFSVFGAWSWLGCVCAAAALALFCAWAALAARKHRADDLGTLCRAALGGAGGRAAAWLNGALVTVTAGAMVAAMGELAALSLPVRPAYAIGVACAVIGGGLAARRGLSAIAVLGGWLLPVCAVLYGALFRLPAENAGPTAAFSARPVGLAFSYAAMNATLSCGVLCEIGRTRAKRDILTACAMAGGMLLALLLCANAVLLRHMPTVEDAALPTVLLARSLGAPGYWLCVVTMVLAVMSTLVALLRTLRKMLEARLPKTVAEALSLALPFAAGAIGFQSLVGGLYPALGAASAALLAAMMAKSIPDIVGTAGRKKDVQCKIRT